MFKSVSAEKKSISKINLPLTKILKFLHFLQQLHPTCVTAQWCRIYVHVCLSQSIDVFSGRFLNKKKSANLPQKPGKSLELHLNPFVCNTTCNTHTHARVSVLWAMCLWISVGIWLLFPFSMSQAQRLSAWVTALRPPRQPDWPLKTQYIISENVTTVLSNYSNTDPDRAFKIDSAIVLSPLGLICPQSVPMLSWIY